MVCVHLGKNNHQIVLQLAVSISRWVLRKGTKAIVLSLSRLYLHCHKRSNNLLRRLVALLRVKLKYPEANVVDCSRLLELFVSTCDGCWFCSYTTRDLHVTKFLFSANLVYCNFLKKCQRTSTSFTDNQKHLEAALISIIKQCLSILISWSIVIETVRKNFEWFPIWI